MDNEFAITISRELGSMDQRLKNLEMLIETAVERMSGQAQVIEELRSQISEWKLSIKISAFIISGLSSIIIGGVPFFLKLMGIV